MQFSKVEELKRVERGNRKAVSNSRVRKQVDLVGQVNKVPSNYLENVPPINIKIRLS